MCVSGGELPASRLQLAAGMAPTDLSHISGLCDEGRYLDGYEASRSRGPLKSWRGAGSGRWPRRLASLLGAPRLAASLRYLAWRADRAFLSPVGAGHYAGQSPQSYAAWKFLDACGEPADRGSGSVERLAGDAGRSSEHISGFRLAQEWHARAWIDARAGVAVGPPVRQPRGRRSL